jgi:hypothetical protein
MEGKDVNSRLSVSARAAVALILLLVPAAARSEGSSARPPAKASPAPPRAGTVRVVANPNYRATGLRRILLGPNYRRLWATPIDVEMLDLGSFAGGLKPVKKGGGKQTKSLRFESADGRQFRVRSVDKDPEAALPPEYRDTFVEWVAQDQISAAHPAGPLIADRLEQALGLPYVTHRFVVIPDDPALGEFRKEFGGMLGILQEEPRLEPPVTPGFEVVEKLYDWEDVWPRMVDESPAHRVDARAYLRARLLDMVIGDWDRHQRQWSWVRVRGQPLLQPFPEDRDQAFSKFDGPLLAIARVGNSRFVNFDEKFPPPSGLNYSARFMDRRVLGELERKDWEEVAREVQEALGDPVLEEAVRRMPPEYFRLVGPRMIEKLRARRAGLPAYAQRYYGMLAHDAEVWGTEEPEVADILKNEDGTVEVRVARVGEGGTAGEPYFRRRYLPGETREVRVYLQGGDDRAVSHARVDSPIEVRVIGDGGNDVLDDSAGGGTHFYDAEGENGVVEGPSTAHSDRPFVPEVDYVGDPLPDSGTRTGPVLWITGAPDAGLIIGLRLVRTAYGFRKYPYRYQHTLGAAYSTGLSGWIGEYKGDFLRTNTRRRAQVRLLSSDAEVIRFHGFGNETVAPEQEGSFYRTDQREYLFQPRFRLGIPHVDFWVGPAVKFTTTPARPGRFLALTRPYGTGDFGEVGLGASLLWDARNHARAATRGAIFQAEGNYYPAVWDVRSAFGEVHGEAAAFVSPEVALQPTLALRVGGKQVWGTFPYHESAFIGGIGTLRGLRLQRYAGDASAWANAELRLRLFRVNLLVPEDVGIFGLADTGRVFLDGEESRRWHTGVGGGLWVSFLRRENTISVAAAHSEGRTRLYFGAGFGF